MGRPLLLVLGFLGLLALFSLPLVSGTDCSSFSTNCQTCLAAGCGICHSATRGSVCEAGTTDGPQGAECPKHKWIFGPVSSCAVDVVCPAQPSCNDCSDIINCGWCDDGTYAGGQCLPGGPTGTSVGKACAANEVYVYATCRATPFPTDTDFNGPLPAEGVGAIFLLIIFMSVAGVILFLWTRPPIGVCGKLRWIPLQGSESSPSDYTSRFRKAIPVVLSLASLTALIIAFAVDRWTYHSAVRDGVRMDITHGLLTYRVKSYDSARLKSFSMSYGEYCSIAAIHGPECNVMRMGALLTLVFGMAALGLNATVAVLAIAFYVRPSLQVDWINRAWFFTALAWLSNFCLGNSYGWVAHLTATHMDGGAIGLSWEAQLGSFWILFILRVFWWYAVQSTTARTGQEQAKEGDVESATSVQAFPVSTELQDANARSASIVPSHPVAHGNQFEDPATHASRVMLYPSLPTGSSGSSYAPPKAKTSAYGAGNDDPSSPFYEGPF